MRKSESSSLLPSARLLKSMESVQEVMQDTTKYARRCSRWLVCSVNRCPLSLPADREHQQIDSADPETVCKENLRGRLRVVEEARADGIELGDALTDRERRAIETGKATVESIIADRDRIADSLRRRGERLASQNGRQRVKTGGVVDETQADPPDTSTQREAS
jgi:hypothetical protein